MVDKSLDFASMDEYRDALVLFDTSPTDDSEAASKLSLSQCRDDARRVIDELKKYGTEINIRRLNFLLRRDFKLNQYDTQTFIRCAMEQGLIAWKNERAIIKFS